MRDEDAPTEEERELIRQVTEGALQMWQTPRSKPPVDPAKREAQRLRDRARRAAQKAEHERQRRRLEAQIAREMAAEGPALTSLAGDMIERRLRELGKL